MTHILQGIPVRVLGTRFNARNCIIEPGPQEDYRKKRKHPAEMTTTAISNELIQP
jgi:hypothetical protein